MFDTSAIYDGLLESHNLLPQFRLHGGVTDQDSADHFDAITIGGGPLPGESDDLCRPDYPDTMFNQVLVSSHPEIASDLENMVILYRKASLEILAKELEKRAAAIRASK